MATNETLASNYQPFGNVAMNQSPPRWIPQSICLNALEIDVSALAEVVYQRTCRTNFDEPGFCIINAGRSLGSVSFRQLMVHLKQAMAIIHAARMQETLVYLSAARFDQQESTKPHLDGGPDECFLMLGYEPSEIQADIEITDYAKCAFELGISPKDLMATHNPMFQKGYDLLRPYATPIPCFSPTDFQIVCINNSSSPYSVDGATWQGTLHTASIQNPDESKRRIINSTLIARAPAGAADSISDTDLDHFINTSEVRRRNYRTTHLADDL